MLPLPRRCRNDIFQNLPLPRRCRDDFFQNLPQPRRHGHLCIMDIQFNQPGYDINCLLPMVLAKTRTVTVYIGENEKLTSSFVTLLKQGGYRGKLFLSVSIDIYFI